MRVLLRTVGVLPLLNKGTLDLLLSAGARGSR